MDYELGNINFSVKSDEQTQIELDAIARQKRFFAEDEGIAGCPWEDDKPVVGWHVDSYPFVCVLMLSDCTNMVGGETALYSGDGKSILKVRGPEMVCRLHTSSSAALADRSRRDLLLFSRAATSLIKPFELSERKNVSPASRLSARKTRCCQTTRY